MIQIIPVVNKYYEQLALFLSKSEFAKTSIYQTKKYWLELFKFWWELNPAFHTNAQKGWVLVNNKNEIKGFLGNIPTLMMNGERTIHAYNMTHWIVEKEYRNYSLLLLTEMIKSIQDLILFNTTPTENVIKIVNYLNFMKLNQSTYKYFLPVNLMKLIIKRIYKMLTM